MKKANFDGLDHHKHAHDEFLKSLRAVSTPVPSDKVTWAKEWSKFYLYNITNDLID